MQEYHEQLRHEERLRTGLDSSATDAASSLGGGGGVGAKKSDNKDGASSMMSGSKLGKAWDEIYAQGARDQRRRQVNPNEDYTPPPDSAFTGYSNFSGSSGDPYSYMSEDNPAYQEIYGRQQQPRGSPGPGNNTLAGKGNLPGQFGGVKGRGKAGRRRDHTDFSDDDSSLMSDSAGQDNLFDPLTGGSDGSEGPDGGLGGAARPRRRQDPRTGGTDRRGNFPTGSPGS